MPAPAPEQLPRVRTISVPRFRKLLGREKGQCTWCGAKLPRHRTSWCSDECVHEFRIRYHASYIRHRVFERDKGVCAMCGNDSHYWLRFYHKIQDYVYNGRWKTDVCQDWRTHKRNKRGRKNRRKMERRAKGSNWAPIHEYSQWEADHIVPVVEGGSSLGLENIRTLCLKCHKRETANLAGKRARRAKRHAAQA